MTYLDQGVTFLKRKDPQVTQPKVIGRPCLSCRLNVNGPTLKGLLVERPKSTIQRWRLCSFVHISCVLVWPHEMAHLWSVLLLPSLRVWFLALCLVGIFPLVLVYVGDISLDVILVFLFVKSSLLRKLLCLWGSSLVFSFEYLTLMSCIGIWRSSWRLYIMDGRSFFGLMYCVLKIFP